MLLALANLVYGDGIALRMVKHHVSVFTAAQLSCQLEFLLAICSDLDNAAAAT